MSYLFDQSVPVDFLYHGILKPRLGEKRPAVRVSSHAPLSPYVIHLAPELPTVDELLGREDLRSIRLNFLVPESELQRVPHRGPEFLSLRPAELHAQLHEEDLTPDDAAPAIVQEPGRGALPAFLRPRVALPSLDSVREALAAFKSRQEIYEPPAEIFDPARLVPARIESVSARLFEPAAASRAGLDVSALLDLPEPEEEADESDVLTFDELAPVRVPEPKPRPFALSLKHLLVFELPPNWHRGLAAFVLVSFAFVLPLHAMSTIQELREARGTIASASERALANLEAAASAVMTRNPEDASDSFARSERQFGKAGQTVEELSGTTELLLSSLPTTRDSLKSGRHLLAAGERLSQAGRILTDGISALNTPAATVTTKLEILSSYVDAAVPLMLKAEQELSEVDEDAIPSAYRATYSDLVHLLPSVTQSLTEVTTFSDTLATLLGDDGRKRYLLVFQNNTELRPTGGFMGSFAQIDVRHGEVENMEIPEGGTYDLQGSLREFLVAPEPLQLLNARWEFQDANWFSDFPTSARQILDFYAAADGPSVDGVVAVNATFVAGLLEILGPVEMSDYGRTIDAENLIFETQKIVELEYEQFASSDSDRSAPAPKAFIGDLAEVLFEKLENLSGEQLLALFDRMNDGLSQRDIQLYFTDESLQELAREFGWSGEIRQTDGDFLHIVDTNLGGGKTDGVIEQDVNLHVRIQQDGSIVNTLTITRTHHGMSSALFTGVNNVDYLRVYVPRGATLMSAEGFTIPDSSLFETPEPDWEIDPDIRFAQDHETVHPGSGTRISEEFGKTVFGNWVQTKPGATSSATFVYRLPFTIDLLAQRPSLFQAVKTKVGLGPIERYSLLIQKQSGVLDRTTHVSIDVPSELSLLWQSIDGGTKEFANDVDGFYAALFERPL